MRASLLIAVVGEVRRARGNWPGAEGGTARHFLRAVAGVAG
jgi:hypothetical protein